MWKCENNNIGNEFKIRLRRYSANPDELTAMNQGPLSVVHNGAEKVANQQHAEEKTGSKWRKDAAATFK